MKSEEWGWRERDGGKGRIPGSLVSVEAAGDAENGGGGRAGLRGAEWRGRGLERGRRQGRLAVRRWRGRGLETGVAKVVVHLQRF